MIPTRFAPPLALAAMLLTAPAASADIVIGVAGPFSGPNATLGEQLKQIGRAHV